MSKKNRTEVTQEIQQTVWDAIIIGSGLTGLTTAATLAHLGKKALVLEQHYVPGGYATSFKRKGFHFEVSLHQTTGLYEGGHLNGILGELGVLDKITPIPLSSTLKLRTNLGELYVGPEYMNQLKKMFPKEAENIDKLDKLIDKVLLEAPQAMMSANLPESERYTQAKELTPTIYQIYNQTLTDILDAYFNDDRLKQLIAVQWPYYGLPQNRISSLLYLLDWGSFLKLGVFYLKGTSQTLSDGLTEQLEEKGGTLLLKQNVEEIIIENGKAVGVRSRRTKKKGDGEEYVFRAPIIVSGANPFYTFSRLMDGEKHIPQSYRDIMDSLEPSASCVIAYIGLDCGFEKFSKDSHHSVADIDLDNYDINKMYQDVVDGKKRGFGEVAHHSAMDPSLAPPGKSILNTLRLEYNTEWKGLSEEEYQAKKVELTEKILGTLDERFPGIRDHIEVIEVATPRTMTRYTNNHNGAFNGFAYTPERVGLFDGGLPEETPVSGLYFANAWAGAVGGGFAGSIPCGFNLGLRLAGSME